MNEIEQPEGLLNLQVGIWNLFDNNPVRQFFVDTREQALEISSRKRQATKAADRKNEE